MQKNATTQKILEKGYRYFDQAQYNDAMDCFSRVMQLDDGNEEALAAYNQVIQVVVPRYHFNMLNDVERNEKYDAAIRRAICGGESVLDVGTGSGLLSMMAARAGAKGVYACEMVKPVAEVAKTVVAANGFADRIRVIGKKSDELVVGVDIPHRLDLLITETIDSALIGEGIIPIVQHAKKYLLADDARIVPMAARVEGALLHSDAVFALNHAQQAVGLDVSGFNQLATQGTFPVRLEMFEHRFLCEPFEICRFDFQSGELKKNDISIPVRVMGPGVCHAVAFWFDLYLDAETTFTSSPINAKTHWKQAVRCFQEPIPVADKQMLTLHVTQDLTRFSFDISQR